MAPPWDDDARPEYDDLDELIRAYGRGEIDLFPRGPVRAAAAGSRGGKQSQSTPGTVRRLSGPAAAELRGGLGAGALTRAGLAGGVQALPFPMLPPPIAPGAPNQIGKALSDIWNGLNALRPPPGGRAQISKPNPYEDECWDMHMNDTAQCTRVRERFGPDEGKTCRETASARYGECLQGGLGRVRTPLYRGW